MYRNAYQSVFAFILRDIKYLCMFWLGIHVMNLWFSDKLSSAYLNISLQKVVQINT